MKGLLLLLAVAFLSSGCASSKGRGEGEVQYGRGEAGEAADGAKVTRTELQQDLQRFAAVFTERVAQGMTEFRKASSPALREEGLRRTLLYGTAAVDIATERDAEVALMDMIVFISLSRDALERYWIPQVFKERGKGFRTAFERSEPEIWAIASKVSTPEQQQILKNVIERWKRENPGQWRVEGVRLGDFSRKAGKIATDRAADMEGLLSGVSKGLGAADDALLLGERVMFLAQRMPFLIRLHTALSTGEIVDVATSRFEVGGTMDGVVQDSLALTQLAGRAAREGTELVKSLYPLILPKKGQLRANLLTANEIAGKGVEILSGLNAVTPVAVERLHGVVGRMFLYLFLVLAGAAGVWWAGYFLVKRKLAAGRPREEERRKAA